MASVIIRNIDDETKSLLRRKAIQNGRSMEEEARIILAKAVHPGSLTKGLGTKIHDLFKGVGGTDDVPEVPRSTLRQPPDFSTW